MIKYTVKRPAKHGISLGGNEVAQFESERVSWSSKLGAFSATSYASQLDHTVTSMTLCVCVCIIMCMCVCMYNNMHVHANVIKNIIYTTGCTNDFVSVNIDLSASTLTCLFWNSWNNTTKTCSVQYSQCNQELVFIDGNSTSNRVVLQFDIPRRSDCYSYTVRASDGTNTVIVKDRFESGKQ